jgi:hypothetical protein
MREKQQKLEIKEKREVTKERERQLEKRHN